MARSTLPLVLIFSICFPLMTQADVLQLKAPAYSAAVNPQTGDLATVSPLSSEALLYKSTAFAGDTVAAPKTCKVTPAPGAIAYKQYKTKGYYIVTDFNSLNACILDAQNFTLIKKIKLNAAFSQISCSLDPNDPLVYVSSPTGRSGKSQVIDLADMKPLDLPTLDGLTTSGRATISADGKTLYYTRIGVSPSGMYAFRKEPAKSNQPLNFSKLAYHHNSISDYTPDPKNIYVCANNRLYDPGLSDLSNPKNMPNQTYLAAFWKTHPMLVAIDRDNGRYSYRRSSWQKNMNVILLSRNTFEKIGSETISPGFTTTDKTLLEQLHKKTGLRHSRFHSSWPLLVLPDEKKDRLMLICGNKIEIFPLTVFGDYKEPWLTCAVEQKNLTPGALNTLSIKPDTSGAVVKLIDGPPGAKIENNKLIWTLSDADVGSHKIKLKISLGKYSRTQIVHLDAARQGIALPTVMQHNDISPDGRYLIGWGGPDPLQRLRSGNSGQSEMMVFDLKNRKLLVKKTMLFNIGQAQVDNHGVYVTPQSTSRLYCLSLKDLSRQKDLMLPDARSQIKALGHDLLSINGQNSDETLLLNTKTRTIRKIAVASSNAPVKTNLYNPAQPGWELGQLVFSPDLSGVQQLIKFNFANLRSAYLMNRRRSSRSYPTALWGVSLRGNSLINSGGQKLASNLPPYQGIILESIPAVAAITTAASGQQSIAKLQLHNLKNGEVIKTVGLTATGRQGYRSSYPHHQSKSLWERQGVLFCKVGDTIYPFKLDSVSKTKCPTPFMIYPDLKGPLELTKPVVTVSFKSTGKPREFELSQGAVAGVTLSPKTGVLKLDRDKLIQTVLDKLEENYQGRMGYRSSRNTLDSEETRWADAMKAYKELFGKMPSGVPHTLLIGVKALDESQCITTNEFSVIFFVPKDKLKKIVQDSQKRLSVPTTTSAPSGNNTLELQKRIRELETENTKLKAKLEAYKELLQSKNP